jgi:hypothetical protein
MGIEIQGFAFAIEELTGVRVSFNDVAEIGEA